MSQAEISAGPFGPSRAPVGIIVSFALLAVAALAATGAVFSSVDAEKWSAHSLMVRQATGRLFNFVQDAETAQRGYLLTGEIVYLAPLNAAVGRIPALQDELRRLTKDNAEQQRRLETVIPIIEARLNVIERSVELRKNGRVEAAIDVVRSSEGLALMNQIRAVLAEFDQAEAELSQLRAKEVMYQRGLLTATVFGALISAGVLGFFILSAGRQYALELHARNASLQAMIEQREAAEAQVRQMQKMESIGQLTGGVAHDFNNMLAIILGSLDLARRRLNGTENPKLVQCLDNATEGAQRASALTARLLAFSRQQPLQPQSLDANKLVAGMSELLRRTLGEAVQVETVLAGGLWRTFADGAQLESAVVNLAVNGRDAMPGGGKLTIETSNADLDERYAGAHAEVIPGQYVMISVSDTGTGMAPDVVERAFDPFFTTKGPGHGTGLGLSQVYGFVKQSGGHVKIYSEIGRGTTVKVYLPRHTGEGDPSPHAADADAIPKGQPEIIVLVVEDDEKVRHLTVDVLRELGYTVVQASNGGHALEQLQVQPRIDLLFTDIVMPDMNGRQLADKARERRPDLKVLYTTGYTRNAVVHNGILDAGIVFLPKPFTMEQLARKVHQVLTS